MQRKLTCIKLNVETETSMTEDRDDTPASNQAWIERIAYHRGRAVQEKMLADQSRSTAARSAHLTLGERHVQLAVSAEMVAAMPDPASPQSSSLHDASRLMRESYGEPN